MFARCLVATLAAAITFVLVAVLLGAAIGQTVSGIPAGQTVIPIIGELAIPVAAAIYVFKRSLKEQPASERKPD